MKRERLFSAAEIAAILSDADNVEQAERDEALNRIRYLSKRSFRDEFGAERPLLQDGKQMDARGKRAYPILEVYRAAIFNDLMALSVDVRALQAVIDAATRKHQIFGPDTRPASMGHEGATVSNGGLLDAIRGVAQGEEWLLIVQQKHGGFSRKSRIAADFLFLGSDTDWKKEQAEVDAKFGARRTRTFIQIDLTELFAPIIDQIGIPQA